MRCFNFSKINNLINDKLTLQSALWHGTLLSRFDVFGWNCFCLMFHHYLCATSSGIFSLAVRWTVCLEWLYGASPYPYCRWQLLIAPCMESYCWSACIWIITCCFLSVSGCVMFESSSIGLFKVYGLVLHSLRAGYQDFFTLKLSSFFLNSFCASEFLSLLDVSRRDSSGYLIKPLFHQKESCLGLREHVRQQKIFHIEEEAVSLKLLSAGFYETFDSSVVDLVATAGESVYSTRCFQVSFNFYGIQVFVNFLDFIYSSYVVFFSESCQNSQLFCGYMEEKPAYIEKR